MRAFLLACLLVLAWADLDSHTYKQGEDVVLWVNKVGPFHNPQETYSYYSLPFCQPEQLIQSKFEGLGEALQGYELLKSPVKIKFKERSESTMECQKVLTEEDVHIFAKAAKEQYWYQSFVDDLPVWGMVGESAKNDKGKETLFLYTHKRFVLTYNDDRIISVNLTTENPQPIAVGTKITFTYSVEWHVTDVTFEKRFEKYLDDTFFEHQIHWFSIFNSFMMLVFLVGLVSMILMRTLNKDYDRYRRSRDPEVESELGDDSGWKQVRSDVFRAPQYHKIFAAMIGTGYQLLVLVLLVIIFSIIGSMYSTRGSTVTVFIVAYALTSFLSGYISGSHYSQYQGSHWKSAMLYTSALFPSFCFLVIFILDCVAVYHDSLASIPLGTMFVVILIWLLVSTPLCLMGTIVGRNWNGKAEFPGRAINPIPRQIPEKPWYAQLWITTLAGGILPFGTIFIEMYFVFTSFWHYKYYYVYGFLLLVYIILLIVTICITIVSTYFLLNAEDWRWQWASFLSAGSTAVYVYLYSIYYFIVKTRMIGFFQTSFYFGYITIFCLGLGLVCGFAGWFGTSIFVRRIYDNIKGD